MPVAFAISPSAPVNTTQPSRYHSMAYNPETNMPSLDVWRYKLNTRQGAALHFGRIMFERFWIKQTSPYRTYSINGISYKYLPPHLFECFGPDRRATLIKPEYEEVWARLKSDVDEGIHKGMLVWGSSGTGKSIALRFLLIECLRNGIRVAIALDDEFHILFDNTGVSLYNDLYPTDPSTLVILQDSFSLAPVPSRLYRKEASTYVVLATSPEPCRYESFVSARAPAVFVMEPWRREELAALLTIDPGVSSTTENMYSLLEVFDLIGPCLKTVLPTRILKTGNVDADFKRLVKKIKSMLASTPAEQWSKSDMQICAWMETENPPWALEELLTIYPTASPQDTDRFDRTPAFMIKIPTAYLEHVFASLVAE